MQSETPLLSMDLRVLQVIGKGHPDRTMISQKRSGSTIPVNALTLSEIQVALGEQESVVLNSIAHLVSSNLVESGRRNPTFLGRLRGEQEEWYAWITPRGVDRLRNEKGNEASKNTDSNANPIGLVASILEKLGFNMTDYGAGVALASLYSGYSAMEVASFIALATFAEDARLAGDDIRKAMMLLCHAQAVVDALKNAPAQGLMREAIFRNDAAAMIRVTTIDPHQEEWITRVLSDEMLAGKERVADRTF
mgnify:CR=1 FL=1